jgi:lipopolysaccharide transport system ATP-binding protein
MGNIAIEADGIGKKYRIGLKKQSYYTFRETVVESLKAPLRRFRRLGGGTISDKEEFWALRDVSFTVEHCEVVGIIGRNGAGKSTLLKILSRITRPTTGEARVYGRVGSLLEVGTGFHPELTGRENIFLNGAVLGMTRAEINRKFDEIVDFSGVEEFLDTPVKRYSSGMAVRLGFSVAAHLDPEILVVDEVLAVGDAEFQKKCLGKMEGIARAGRTVLFVSHNMSLISSLCKRVILFSSGSIASDGDTAVVVDHYMHSTAQAYQADLNEVPNYRWGAQEYAKLHRISLFDEDMRPADTFFMGQGMIVRLAVECKRPMKNALAGVKVLSRFGSAIHYFVSTWEGLRVDLPVGLHIFEFRIPRILLYPGRYYLSPWTAREGNPSEDRVERVLVLNVLGRDITGHTPDFDGYACSGGEVYAPCTCSLLDTNEAASSKACSVIRTAQE